MVDISTHLKQPKMDDDIAEVMDVTAIAVAGVRFNIVVIKTGMIQWLREVMAYTEDEDLKDRCKHFIDALQKGMSRDTGRVQRRTK